MNTESDSPISTPSEPAQPQLPQDTISATITEAEKQIKTLKRTIARTSDSFSVLATMALVRKEIKAKHFPFKTVAGSPAEEAVSYLVKSLCEQFITHRKGKLTFKTEDQAKAALTKWKPKEIS